MEVLYSWYISVGISMKSSACLSSNHTENTEQENTEHSQINFLTVYKRLHVCHCIRQCINKTKGKNNVQNTSRINDIFCIVTTARWTESEQNFYTNSTYQFKHFLLSIGKQSVAYTVWRGFHASIN